MTKTTDNIEKLIKCEFYGSKNKLSCITCEYAGQCLSRQLKEMTHTRNIMDNLRENAQQCADNYEKIIDEVKQYVSGRCDGCYDDCNNCGVFRIREIIYTED